MCVYVGIFFDVPAAGGVLCASLASLGVPCGRVQGGGAGRRPSAGGLQPAIESLIYYETGEVHDYTITRLHETWTTNFAKCHQPTNSTNLHHNFLYKDTSDESGPQVEKTLIPYLESLC